MRPGATGSRLVILNWRDRRHPSAGGAELYCERVARELATRGHDVVLVTSRPAGAAARERTDGYDVRRLGGWCSVYPLALLWLLKHRRSVGGVVDSQNGIPFFSPLLAGSRIPVVLLVHHVHQDLFTRALRPSAARLARWLEGPLTRRVYRHRTVVVLSPSARTAVRRRLRLDGHIRVVPGGADTRDALRRRADHPRVVVVGRLTPHKRLSSLIAAMAAVSEHVPAAELHLVGDGPARQALEARARAAGAPVVFHGRLSDARRDEVLATAWLTVSASDGGDWALPLLEANAAGVPALARRVTGLRDTVRHGETGWLVDEAVEDIGSATARALTTLSDPGTAAALAERARAWAARFTWERTADGLLQALSSEAARQERTHGSRDRRTGNDVMVVLDVAEEALPAGWQALQRSDDVWVSDGGRMRGLLAGADELDALAVLERLRIDAADPSVEVLVARHADVLGVRPAHPDDAIELVDLATQQAAAVAVPPVQAAVSGAPPPAAPLQRPGGRHVA